MNFSLPFVQRPIATALLSVGLFLVGCACVGAAMLTRLLQSLLYDVGAHDPLTFAVVPGLIVLTALVASALPALRAARVDPLSATRAE